MNKALFLAVRCGILLLLFVSTNAFAQQQQQQQRSSIKTDTDSITNREKQVLDCPTGATTTIPVDKIDLKGYPDISKSIQTTLPGLLTTDISGTFGVAPLMTIRGNNTILGTSKPLWVIDGVIWENLVNLSSDDLLTGDWKTLLSSNTAGINPADIEKIEVRRDYAATVQYGAPGANGVILITTKKGTANRFSVQYTGTFAVKDRPSISNYNKLDATDEIAIYKELHQNGWIHSYTPNAAESMGVLGKMYDEVAKGNLQLDANSDYNNAFLERHAQHNTDWFKTLFHHSIVNQHAVNIRGGNQKATYYTSLSYYHDDGIVIQSDKSERYTGSFRGDIQLTKQLQIGAKIAANIRSQRTPGVENSEFMPYSNRTTRDFEINPFLYALQTARSMQPYNEQGELEYYRRNYADFNILNELATNYTDLNVKDLSTQLDLNYRPLKNLTVKGIFQYRLAKSKAEHKVRGWSNEAGAYKSNYTAEIRATNPYLFHPYGIGKDSGYSMMPQGGIYHTTDLEMRQTYIKATADYVRSLGNKHHFHFMAGFEFNRTKRETTPTERWGYLWDEKDKDIVEATYTPQLGPAEAPQQEYLTNKNSAYFATIDYTYRNKYRLDMGYRVDKTISPLLYDKKITIPSWSISTAWNLHNEPFMQGIKEVVSYLRPKISYGYKGVLPLSMLTNERHYYVIPYYSDINQDQSEQGSTAEKTHEVNIGLEAALFSQRISVEIDYYHRTSKDLLNNTLSNSMNRYSFQRTNIGKMKSSGLEMALHSVNIATTNFRWESQFTLNTYHSEVTEMKADYSIPSLMRTGIALEGGPERGLYSVRFAGLDQNGLPTFYRKDNKIITDLYTFLGNDAKETLKYEGPIAPKGFGGFSNSFRFKQWNASFDITYRYGNVIRLNNADMEEGADIYAYDKSMSNRWVSPGDETNIPILSSMNWPNSSNAERYELYNMSTERVAKGDFIRLKQITIGYTFPKEWLKGKHISQANLSLQATNLCLLYSDSKLHGIDPEYYTSGGVSMPTQRMYSLTLQLQL